METHLLHKSNKTEYQERLLLWFSTHGRDFPWRHTQNPFHILIAEKLLQQTKARPDLVRAYENVVSLYPTPQHLASADLAELSILLKSLGLHYRASELITLAGELIRLHHGVIPQDLQSLLQLPGIGDYAARAVLSFAYNEDVPIVDTNVARLLYRLYLISEPMPPNPARKKTLISAAAELVPKGQARAYNLAILDLCALVCTVRKPHCDVCPVRSFCLFGMSNLV